MSAHLATIDSGSKGEPLGIAIPPQPSLLADITEAFPNTEKVATLIAQDSHIKSGVLKVVNSPCLGLSQSVDKLDQAIMLLGLDSVMNVVNAVLLHDSLAVDGDAKLEAYWKNTQDTAAAAGMLAAELTGVKPDDAYLLGLFRDCAIPLIYQKFPNYFSILQQAYTDHAARIIAIEDKQIKANHAVVGHLIARMWNLPPAIIQAVKDHHHHRRLMCLGETDDEKYIDRLCATLKLAEHVARNPLIYGKTAKNYEWEVYKNPILKLIDKPPQEILDTVNAITVTLRETEDLLL